MPSIKQCDAFLAKHHQYVSPLVLALALIVALDLVTPTMLLAQEVPPASIIPINPPIDQSNPPSVVPVVQPQNPQTPQQNQGQPMPPQNLGGEQPGQVGGQSGPVGNFGPQNGPGPMMGDGGQFSKGQPGNFGGQNGPSEEQMAKEQARRDANNLKQMKNGMRGMEQGIKMFQKQIDRLIKQGIAVPTETTENIAKINTLIQTLKSTENFQDAQEQMQELPDLMQSLDEQRMNLEKLSRWPRTLKQADQILKQLNRTLTQNKNLSLKLAKTGYDISDIVSKFEASVQAMKDSRDKAVELIKTDPDAAYDEVQNNLFEQMDDVMQSDRTIKELGNLSRFNSSFKRGLAEGQSMIRKLKAKKIDTADLEAKLLEIKAKAAEINAIISQKPIDTEAIVGVFEDLDSMRQEFQNMASDLMGDGNDMPWEGGPQQFKRIDTGSINKFMPQSGGSGPGFGGPQSGGGPGMNNAPQMAPGTF